MSEEYYPYYTMGKFSKQDEEYSDAVINIPKDLYDRYLKVEKERELFNALLRAYVHNDNLDIIEKTAALKGLL